MPAFAPRPTFNTWDRQQQIGIALDRPFTFGEAVGENFVQGILDSFGLGTVVRENMVPELADGRPYTRAGLGIRLRTQEELERTSLSRAITKEQYEASPNFRTDVPWEQGMTDERAAALASLYDKKKVREFFSQKQPIAMFLGQLGGQALDPVNYVPVFSDGVRAAAVARMGSITGRAMLSASEAAINTAAFGVATREARAKYGDNVSWEAMTTEIAMSAVIGGLFGAGVGVIARGADKRAMALNRVQPRLETLGNVMQARAAINDAVAGLVDNAEVRLNPNSVGVIERMADQVVERTSGLKALRDETAAVTGSRPGEVVISPSGTRVQVRPEVVEASTLIRATGALQVRDRTSAASDAQVEDIAINLDPARLMPNVDASQGSPLVGADNIVDSGNGRVMAIKRAYEAYPDKAEAYRAALIEAGYADAAGMQQPVLISRRVTDLSETARAQFNAEVNGPTTARLSAVELAAMDREALSDMVMQALDDAAPVTAASNRAFVQRFLASLPQNERSALLDRGGALNADGARRIENALVARAYGDQDVGVVRRFAEATDDNTRAIVGALSDVAGTWSKMRDAVKSQEISAEFDLTPELTQALRLLGRWREQAASEKRPVANVISEGLAQLDLLSGEVSPEAKTFIGMFYTDDGYTRAVGRDTLAARLRTVAESTIELGRPSLFGDTMIPTKGEVLTNAQREQADAFAADGLEPRAQEDSGAGEGRAPEGAGGAGGQGAADNTAGIASAFPPPAVAEKVQRANEFVTSQPARSLDDTYAVIGAYQDDLDVFGQAIARERGATWRNPGLKAKEGAAEKMVRKGYETTAELTDLVRGGFEVRTPGDADAIVDGLRQRYSDILDEGWRMTAVNYFDRKVLVRFDDGTIGEVQFWHPKMFDTKETRGHLLYEEARKLEAVDPTSPRLEALFAEQRALYAAALPSADPAWSPVINGLLGKSAAPGNATRNAASLMGSPESMISTREAEAQPLLDLGTNQPLPSTMAAGRPSQLNSDVSMGTPRRPLAAIDATEPAPDPVPDGLVEAEARVGKGEDIRQIAEVHGVKEDGSFVEQLELDQMREEGKLTPEDEAELEAAEQLYADADAWARSLEVAGRCMI